jgi:hypothetical protein
MQRHVLWNGNKCGNNQGDENLEAVVPNTDYDR